MARKPRKLAEIKLALHVRPFHRPANEIGERGIQNAFINFQRCIFSLGFFTKEEIRNQVTLAALTIFIIALINILIVISGNFKCPWNESLQIYCAGCGGTRMLYSILRLEFYQAFRYNPLLFIFLILAILYSIYLAICTLIKIKYYKLNTNHLIIIAIIVIVFMIIRNIECFSYLQPTKI